MRFFFENIAETKFTFILNNRLLAYHCDKILQNDIFRSSLSGPTHLSPCPCIHTKNFENFNVFCTKKCGRPHLKPPSLSEKCPYWTTPLHDCGRLLWKVPNVVLEDCCSRVKAMGTHKRNLQ